MGERGWRTKESELKHFDLVFFFFFFHLVSIIHLRYFSKRMHECKDK